MPGSNSGAATKQPDHFIVVIPGYMGSKLRDKTTKKIVWMDVPAMLKDPLHIGEQLEGVLSAMAYPGNLEPAGIVNEVLFIPPWVKQEQYGVLLAELKQAGFRDDPAKPPFDRPVVFTFAYDWRQDNRISARQLGEAVKGWSALLGGAKAWLIGHSNGGIVSRWYIEKEGGKDYVERLYLMGSPWNGAPKALNVLMNGLDMIFLKALSTDRAKQLMKEIIPSFPSYYQLIPYAAPFIFDEQRVPIDLFADPGWIGGPKEQQMLMDGRKFNEEPGHHIERAHGVLRRAVQAHPHGWHRPARSCGALAQGGLGIHRHRRHHCAGSQRHPPTGQGRACLRRGSRRHTFPLLRCLYSSIWS